jgi:hypothetical protein
LIIARQDDDLGGYMIQQNVGGHPVAIFRFPQWVRFPANATATVWAGCNDPLLHQPPSDFVFKEQYKWGTGPECTTILCKPNNQVKSKLNLVDSVTHHHDHCPQAVAWTTAAHRFNPDYFAENGPLNTIIGHEGDGLHYILLLSSGTKQERMIVK